MRIRALTRLLTSLVFAACALAGRAQIHTSPNDGPGLGNLTYSQGELFRHVSVIPSPTIGRQGPGNVDMVNGYLMVATETDGGGTAGTGGVEFWDVSNPRNPRRVARHDNANTHGMRENHGFGVSYSYPGDYIVMQGHDGILFWDVTDPLAIRLLNYFKLPGIAAGDYTGAWWLFWQAPYVYVAGQNSGLYIVDARDPANPKLARQIPTGELGGYNVGIVQALGNLLWIAGSNINGHRMTTLDISDPVNPRVLNFYAHGPLRNGYSAMMAGGRIYTAGGDAGEVVLRQYNLSHDGVITLADSAGPMTGTFENGGYLSIQSGYVFAGFSNKIAKFRISPVLTAVGEAASGFAGDDEDFAVALGNIIFVGDDHGRGSTLVPHQAEPDTVGPEVEWIHPPSGATNLAVTSRVGISLSEIVDLDSVHGASFIVRPASGGAAIPGKYSKQHHLVNFSPDEPLFPDTTYEVIVDGLKDHVGNRSGRFTATFRTGVAPRPQPVARVTFADGSAGQLGRFSVGAALWSDRPKDLELQAYFAAPYPAGFEGQDYVVTRNDDRQSTAANSINLDLVMDATVFVLFDADRVPLPSWLKDGTWIATGSIVNTTDTGSLRRLVYAKPFGIGLASLGGNAAPSSASSMYSVVVVPAPQSPPTCQIVAPGPVQVGASARYRAATTGGSMRYSWSFGDGSPQTPESASAEASHAYGSAGRYPVLLQVKNNVGRASCSVNQIVHHPVTVAPAVHSSTIAHAGGIVYAVNADSDTVSAIDAASLQRLWEAPAGAHPRTLAVAPSGEVWVVNQDDATISVLDPLGGHTRAMHVLRLGSQPYGIAFGPGGKAYVTLQGTGELVRLSAAGAVEATVAVGQKPRGVAISGDGERIFVTQFVSQGTVGRVREVSAASFSVVRTFELAFDAGPDSSVSGRGIPNYLTTVTISPDGRFAVVPSKKDNIARGLFRDGQELDFQTMVRAIVSEIDLLGNSENPGARLDLNDRAMPQAAIFSPLGDVFLVSTQGTNTVEFIDSGSGATLGAVDTGLAPQGMALNADASRLFVHNFMGRSISVFDVRELVEARSNAVALMGEVQTTSVERLSPQVLLGKRIFYNAADPRMARDKYVSCASCHLDGDSDQQVWDFTQVGEGFRNTISLIGKAGMAHGRVHWTANFDEIQDFENDMRHFLDGTGFMSNAAFIATGEPLGAPKAGLSPELDALAAFVSSLAKVPDSPYRGLPATAAAIDKGRKAFVSQGCVSCHAGPNFTDGRRWDVGTIKPHSGEGLHAPLAGVGFRTPSLRNVWSTAPYLHDGSAATLGEVLDNTLHVGALNANQKEWLVQYLLQIDGLEPAPQ